VTSASTLRRLTLLRHAQAEPVRAGASDRERQLDRRGHSEAADAAQRLADTTPLPDLLLVSPAVRTRQTADCVMRHLALARLALRLDESLYLAEPEVLLDALGLCPDAAQHILVVGHNPGLSALGRQLALAVAPSDLPTGGLLTIRVAAERWADISRAPVHDARYDCPTRLD